MSGLEDDAYAALVSLIASTWSELTTIVREEQIGRTNWENLLANGSLTPPFAVIRLGPSQPEPWGIDNLAFRLTATLTAVVSITDTNAAISGGTDVTAYLLQQLGLVRAAVIGYTGTAFQLAGEHPVVDCSTRSEANQLLLNLQAGLQVGEISCSLLVGSSP
jgi:hypothetical protein